MVANRIMQHIELIVKNGVLRAQRSFVPFALVISLYSGTIAPDALYERLWLTYT